MRFIRNNHLQRQQEEAAIGLVHAWTARGVTLKWALDDIANGESQLVLDALSYVESKMGVNLRSTSIKIAEFQSLFELFMKGGVPVQPPKPIPVWVKSDEPTTVTETHMPENTLSTSALPVSQIPDLLANMNATEVAEKIEDIYYSASERPKARFALALLALMRLGGGKSTVYSRKDLFSPIPNPKQKKDVKALIDEGMAKDWQRKFVDRLKKDQLVSVTGNYLSSPDQAQKDQLSALMLDAINDGTKLKAILWPSQYEDFDETSAAFEDAIEVEPPVAAASQSSEFDVVKEISDRMAGLNTHLETLVGHLSQIYALMSGQVERIELANTRLEILLKAVKDENKTKLTALIDRMLEQDSRRKTLISQLTTAANQDDKIIAEAKAVYTILKDEES